MTRRNPASADTDRGTVEGHLAHPDDRNLPRRAHGDNMDALLELQAAGTAWIDASEREAIAEAARITLRAELVDSLIGSTNPQTEKPHSATSAEKAAENTAEYANAKEAARAATKAQRLAFLAYEIAKLKAKAAVAMAAGVAP